MREFRFDSARRRFLCGAAVSGTLSLGLLMAPTRSVLAQRADPPTAPPESTGSVRGRPRTIGQVIERLAQESGMRVLVTAELASQQVNPPPATTEADGTPTERLENSLDTLARRVSSGTWTRLYLPPPPAGRRYSGDSLAQFAQAQTGLFGRSAKPAAGTVDLLGRRMTDTEAAPVIRAMALEPYYIFYSRRTTPTGDTAPGTTPTEAPRTDPVTDALLKQLGVRQLSDVPPGQYIVNVTGPDGVPRRGQVTVSRVNGGTRLSVIFGRN